VAIIGYSHLYALQEFIPRRFVGQVELMKSLQAKLDHVILFYEPKSESTFDISPLVTGAFSFAVGAIGFWFVGQQFKKPNFYVGGIACVGTAIGAYAIVPKIFEKNNTIPQNRYSGVVQDKLCQLGCKRERVETMSPHEQERWLIDHYGLSIEKLAETDALLLKHVKIISHLRQEICEESQKLE
jgi:hypothetical protein